MSEEIRTRVVAREGNDGKTRLSIVDVTSGRHVDTGLSAPSKQAGAAIRRLKEQLESKGHQVTVHEG